MAQSHRIVTLIASATEIVCALGLREQLVGRSHECDFPKHVLSLPKTSSTKFLADGSSYEIHERLMAIVQEGLSVYKVDAALLNELRPDILITQDQCEVCAVSFRDLEGAVCEMIESRPKILSLKTDCMNDLWRDIRRVAEICEVPDAGEKLVRGLQNRIEEISKLAAAEVAKTGKHSVANIEWISPLMTAGNWMPELVAFAGGVNCFGEAGKHSPWIEWDTVRAANPDVLFISPCGFDLEKTDSEAQSMKQLPGWSELKAVQNDRVYIADGNAYFHRPGPRLVESLEILTAILHPQLKEKLDTGTFEEAYRKFDLS